MLYCGIFNINNNDTDFERFVSTPWFEATLLALWLVYLFCLLGVASDGFFVPNLEVFSKSLG